MIYKVHIKPDAGGVVYSTNGTTLARVEGVKVSQKERYGQAPKMRRTG